HVIQSASLGFSDIRTGYSSDIRYGSSYHNHELRLVSNKSTKIPINNYCRNCGPIVRFGCNKNKNGNPVEIAYGKENIPRFYCPLGSDKVCIVDVCFSCIIDMSYKQSYIDKTLFTGFKITSNKSNKLKEEYKTFISQCKSSFIHDAYEAVLKSAISAESQRL